MKRLAILLPIVLLLVLALPSVVSAEPTIQLYEGWSGTTANYTTVYAGHWTCQTFIANGVNPVGAIPESHTVFSVYVALMRVGSDDIGDIVVGIREVDPWNRPTGGDIATGILDSTLVSNATLHAFLVVMSSEVGLSYNTTYAVVVSCEGGDASNAIRVASGTTAASPYAYGDERTTTDGGVTWSSAHADTDAFFTIVGRPLLDVNAVKVFRDYYEDGDLLFCVDYENFYVPYYPADDSPSYFKIQLRDTDGTTILAQTTCNAWGWKPAEIYLSADSAAPLDVGEPYMIVLEGTSVPEDPSANYTLVGDDWKGSDLRLLRAWVLNLAKELEDYYDTDLVVASGDDELLNDQGAVFFLTGMPSLAHLVPNLFAVGAVEAMGFGDSTGAFDAAVTWDTEVGTEIADAVGDTADILGVDDPQSMAGIIVMVLYLGLVAFLSVKHVDISISAILAVFIVLAGSQLRIFPFALVATIGSAAIILLTYRFWWKNA